MDKWEKEKISKIPISPITLKSDDWNDKKHWTDFETAVKNLERSGLDGLSFALSKDDFVLLLFLKSFTHGNADMMKEIFLRSALNRMGDKSKRRTEAGYLRYLDESIRKALQGGNQRYWDYSYHRKKGGYLLE